VRDIHVAEDATQVALVVIWRDLRKLRDPARFGGWSPSTIVPWSSSTICWTSPVEQVADALEVLWGPSNRGSAGPWRGFAQPSKRMLAVAPASFSFVDEPR
jgi:hypothetical protein